MPGSVFLSWKKTPCGAFWGSSTVYRGQLCEPPTDHCHMFEHCRLTRHCNKRNSLSLCSDLNWVLMVSTFLSLFPTPSTRWKPQARYLSVSLTDSSVLSLYSGTVSFKSMHTLPTNARCPNLSVEHTEKESEDVSFFFDTSPEESKNTFKLKLSWKHENVKSHHLVLTLWQ